MTQEDIIRMARKAGASMQHGGGFMLSGVVAIERVAALVAAEEREACAKQLDALGCDHCAAAIRSRGNT